ncbi:hypothetical protein SY88_15240 [Clostridiales bacterium PH28_bin88]|nr:hypothetical protein SY88_15240 [Clostridiales bacterium PH28_bin88]
MQGNLIFIWQQDKLGLVFGKEEIVLAAEEFCSGFQALGETIRHFLKRHGISPSNIKNVIVVADLTALLPRQLAKESVFGYWRVTPAPFDFAPIAPLIEDSAIKIHSFHLPLPEHSEHEAHFQKALLTFSRLPVRNIAINSTFSRIYPAGEEEIIQRAEELLPGRFTYHPSHNYNTPNFLLRENVLLINLILLDPVKSFLSWLKSSFDDCSVSAPLYFLKGDGTLTSSRTVATNPLITWQSHLASFLLGGSRWFNQGDTVVIIENTGEKGIGLGVTENYLPRLAGRFSSFCGVELPGNYPLTVHLKERPNKTRGVVG